MTEDPQTLELYETEEGYFIAQPLPEKELEEYYSQKYYKEDCATYKHEYSGGEIGRFTGKVERVIKILGNFLSQPSENCLEIGCGEGWGLQFLIT